jgi:glycosyltransferase involved in cell wall biosynthesis
MSVIIPVHNKAETLPRMFEGLFGQDFPAESTEIIFVADHCTDQSLNILNSVKEKDSVKLLIVNEGKGSAAKARNIGLKVASGEYCLFLDADIIIPSDFFRKIHNHLHDSKNTVCLSPVYGNSISDNIWSFTVQNHNFWLDESGRDILEWASLQPRLNDLRLQWSDGETGSLNHLPAPWVFCWSSALAAEKTLIEKVGGFIGEFFYKGSEDLDLGYRLHLEGTQFKLMTDTYVFHMPHVRNRDYEELTDRLHEREMLKRYVSPEMEALCAFDGAHANQMLRLLSEINAKQIYEMHNFWECSVNLKNLHLPTSLQLITGIIPSWLTEEYKDHCVICPYTDLSERSYPLFGFALPFEDKAFCQAAMIGLWQLLPERLACRLFDEVTRVAEEVFLLKLISPTISTLPWTDNLVQNLDAPYWDRTCRVRRSFYDFNLVPVGYDHPVCSYKLSRVS